MDIWFQADAGGGSLFSWGLKDNITVADGNYTWDPREIRETLASNNSTLSAEKEHYFEAHLHNANHTWQMGLESDKYEVEGYDGIGSGGVGMRSLLGTRGFLVATGALMVTMAWCM